MAQWIQGLLCDNEDPSLATVACNPAAGEAETKRSLGVAAISLAKSVSFGLTERPCLKKHSGELLREKPNIDLWPPCTHAQTYIHTHTTHVHTQTHTHEHT